MQRDISDLVNHYRDACRLLWNGYLLRHDLDFDTVDAFDGVRVVLFNELVVERLRIEEGVQLPSLASEHFTVHPVRPYEPIKVMPQGRRVPIHINRRLRACGYWDADPQEIESADLLLIDCFDWDERAFRDLTYYRVQVVRIDGHDEVAGREALIAATHCRLLLVHEV
jgi:hypothetical protein